MGNDEVSPVATRTGQIVGGSPTTLAAPVRHVFVIHDDGSLSKILIARCFPVAFGPPLANVSDPSGLNCVDLPVANLGDSEPHPDWWQLRDARNRPCGQSLRRLGAGDDERHDCRGQLARIRVLDQRGNDVVDADPGTDPRSREQRVRLGSSGRRRARRHRLVRLAAHVDPAGGPQACPNGGPDAVPGPWSLYLTQTLTGHSTSVSFTQPVLASEHPVRRGGIQTIIGNQCGGTTNLGLSGTTRTLGDFFQLRIGSKGEAQISYADSENIDGNLMGSHAMYVSQIGGTGVARRRATEG